MPGGKALFPNDRLDWKECMRKMEKAYFNWSSGKDSALALYHVIRSEIYSVETLFSLLKTREDKIAMHEIGGSLLKQQAEAIGIPLTIFKLDTRWHSADYESAMTEQMYEFRQQGITTALFGDLYLEDLRKNREANCRKAGIRAGFPLWGMPSSAVMREFIHLAFKAIITCVDNAVLSDEFVGKVIDEDFIKALPENVDICGEKGEYHSFVFDGPIFRHPIEFQIKGKYYRDYPELNVDALHRYWYLELE